MSKFRYTEAEWNHLDRISAEVYHASEAVRRRMGGGFKVPYPLTDPETRERVEQFFLELDDTLESAHRELIEMLDGENVVVED